MRHALTLAMAAGLVLGLTGAASACNWNKTAEKKMTIAEAEKPTIGEAATEDAVTTFEPVEEDQLKEKVADEE